jgi:hypothetical protein
MAADGDGKAACHRISAPPPGEIAVVGPVIEVALPELRASARSTAAAPTTVTSAAPGSVMAAS